MNKSELVKELTSVVKTRKQAQEAVDLFLGKIIEQLRRGESVTLTGFGTFKVVDRQARKGRNPLTGEEIKIEARKVPKFIPGKLMKETIK